jgi:hypothetical protein
MAAGRCCATVAAGRFPRLAWLRLERPLRDWIGTFPPYVAHDFAKPTHYSNRKLVWAVGALALAQNGVSATAPGAVRRRSRRAAGGGGAHRLDARGPLRGAARGHRFAASDAGIVGSRAVPNAYTCSACISWS